MHSPFQASTPQPGSAGGRQRTHILGKGEGRKGNLKVTRATPSFPFHFLQASSQKHNLLHWHLFPPPPTFSHPLPSQPKLASSGQICQHDGVPFHFLFSSIFPISNKGGVSHSALRAAPPVLSFDWNTSSSSKQMLSEVFKQRIFKDKKCQRTKCAKPFHHFPQCWAWLATLLWHSGNLQQVSVSCKGDRRKT